MLLRRVARPLLSVAFVGQGLDTLRNPDRAADAAVPAMQYLRRLPDPAAGNLLKSPKQLALFNASVQIGAGVLLATGKIPRIASAALAATVIPGNLGTHMFWAEDDPERRAEKRRAFMTDASLLGGLVIASADTAGRPSVGWRGRRTAQRLTETLSSTLHGNDSHSLLSDSALGERLTHGLQSSAERGRELVSTASEKSAPLLEAALKHGAQLAESARETGAGLAQTALQRGAEFAQSAQGDRTLGAGRRFTTRFRRSAVDHNI